MKLDIVIVTYNSENWMKNCINAIEKQKNIKLSDVNLIIIDNNSNDKTIDTLKQLKKDTKLGNFIIENTGENLGFGRSNNLGFNKGESDYVLFLNPDTELEEDSLYEAYKSIENSEKEFAMWEFRQKPYEHPKWYDINTGETSWSSGACFIIKRSVFKEVNGFDSKIFMYAEDVDLSWNVRLHGYKIKYVPKATVVHYCYKTAGEIKPVQYFNSIINNLNLRLKYGSKQEIRDWYTQFKAIMTRQGPFEGSRKGLLRNYIKNLKYTMYYLNWRNQKDIKEKFKDFKPIFLGFDYEGVREGAFLANNDVEEKPLVSIIIRTCGRPNILRETLNSLKNQTYKNIEIVIIEDGKNISEEMIKKEFSDLNIVYKATGEKKGRCIVGNIGLETAKGKYLNFLDDDDLFYADHVETLVKELVKHPDYKLAYSLAYESKIEVQETEPEYKYKEVSKSLPLVKKFSRITLLTRNAFPIQAVMFEKDIFLKYGGLDEELDNLEDWEMWARYAQENKFLYVPKVTSVYRVPAKQQDYDSRKELLDSYYKKAQEKIFARNVVVKPEDLLEEIKYI